MRNAPTIDIVTRLYDLADLPQLDKLLFSIMGQADAVPLRLHLMLQRFSSVDVQAVREATSGLRRLHDRVSVTLHNWDHPAPFDLRIPLLNWGLEVAQGRYLTCLDVVEQLCPNACMTLLTRLYDTRAAITLGGTLLQPVSWWGDVVLPIPDQVEGAAPMPIFLADRERLAVKDVLFRSGEPGSEIKEFLERLSTRYTIDTTCQSQTIAIRTFAI